MRPARVNAAAESELGRQLTEWGALGFHGLRSALFFAESLPLVWLQRPPAGGAGTAGRGRRRGPAPDAAPRASRPSREALETVLARLRALFEQDARAIARGVIPLSVLAPRDLLGHGGRFLRILGDARTVVSRRARRDSRDFGGRAKDWLDELPAYYRRNFHYQTDGYLSERSAELYEHQVELLFRGGADAMRRLIVPPLREHFADDSRSREARDGQGLRFLELGSGTGSATHAVARAFPRAKITCLDLSFPYTRHARRQLAAYDRVECVQGDAARLEFADGRFDAVYSVFLFHELPLPVRELVLDEARRVLKPGGFFGMVDSLQKGDDPELDWALDFFPREFHEPYYAHYAAHPMEPLVRRAGFGSLRQGTGYLAKWISARATTRRAARPAVERKTVPEEAELEPDRPAELNPPNSPD
ncbi:MAG: class I SAM-dependent methyltransferase [Myxococcota bacterium]